MSDAERSHGLGCVGAPFTDHSRRAVDGHDRRYGGKPMYTTIIPNRYPRALVRCGRWWPSIRPVHVLIRDEIPAPT
jgi:hypothetical protein